MKADVSPNLLSPIVKPGPGFREAKEALTKQQHGPDHSVPDHLATKTATRRGRE